MQTDGLVRRSDVNCAGYRQCASMSTSDEYRKIADEYYRLAREAKTESDRLALLDLAHTWLEAASREGEMTSEQIAEAQKLAREWKPKPER